MDGLFHGKPYFLIDDLGGKNPYFWKHPYQSGDFRMLYLHPFDFIEVVAGSCGLAADTFCNTCFMLQTNIHDYARQCECHYCTYVKKLNQCTYQVLISCSRK